MLNEKGEHVASPPPVEHPPHMLDAPRTNAQRKAFAKVKKAAKESAQASAPESKPAAKKKAE